MRTHEKSTGLNKIKYYIRFIQAPDPAFVNREADRPVDLIPL